MKPQLDFSDAVFGALEPQTFARPPALPVPPPTPPADEETMSIPKAATFLNESRQTTWRRVKAGELEEIRVGGRSFVRRADVVALLDAGKSGRRRAQRPPSLASTVASGRARATSEAVSDQLAELVATVAAMQTELRSVHNAVRALLLARGHRGRT